MPRGVVNWQGLFYGLTIYGGIYSAHCYFDKCGTAFSITPAGVETVITSFGANSNDGYFPNAGLAELDGSLWGTTTSGGQYNQGTVFSLSPTGKKTYQHDFGRSGDSTLPAAGLYPFNGLLYGTTKFFNGGKGCMHSACSTVFVVIP